MASYSHVLQQGIVAGGVSTTRSKEYTAQARHSLEETIPAASTDLQINVAIDVSAVKSFYLVCDQAVTIQTNDGTTPDDTIVLKAGVPYVWNEDSYDTFKLTVDVTAFYVTWAGGVDATLIMEEIHDPTPP